MQEDLLYRALVLWHVKGMFSENYEEFTDAEIKTLERYVTHTSRSVFALCNLPEVIKGALFSRYSRSSLGLRSLLLKEFINNQEETGFDTIAGATDESAAHQALAIQKAQNFYDRILDGYGDDSIGELGGAHLAVENVSMIAAKFIEEQRIGGSPLEKSTRYVYYDQKLQGEYLFYREPILMTSAFRDLYLETCNHLFETYSRLIPPLTTYFEERFPKDPNSSKGAYSAAMRAKVLDCLRGLLPASTLTNMGVFGNGRFFENLIHRLHTSNLAEMQEIGKMAYEELSKIIPSFVRRASLSHRTHQAWSEFHDAIETELRMTAAHYADLRASEVTPGAHLIDWDPQGPKKVAAATLFAVSPFSLKDLKSLVEELPDDEVDRILEAATYGRETRRHKSPRALEHASFTFEIVADFGAYRDLQRHRMLTQERQLLGCELGYFVPEEILGTPMHEPYIEAMERAKKAWEAMAGELPEEAQYVVPMAFHLRWYFSINLRALQWLCELRSQAAGHPTYRFLAQQMTKEVIRVLPQFERFFKFVDYEGYDLGRLGAEERKAARK